MRKFFITLICIVSCASIIFASGCHKDEPESPYIDMDRTSVPQSTPAMTPRIDDPNAPIETHYEEGNVVDIPFDENVIKSMIELYLTTSKYVFTTGESFIGIAPKQLQDDIIYTALDKKLFDEHDGIIDQNTNYVGAETLPTIYNSCFITGEYEGYKVVNTPEYATPLQTTQGGYKFVRSQPDTINISLTNSSESSIMSGVYEVQLKVYNKELEQPYVGDVTIYLKKNVYSKFGYSIFGAMISNIEPQPTPTPTPEPTPTTELGFEEVYTYITEIDALSRKVTLDYVALEPDPTSDVPIIKNDSDKLREMTIDETYTLYIPYESNLAILHSASLEEFIEFYKYFEEELGDKMLVRAKIDLVSNTVVEMRYEYMP